MSYPIASMIGYARHRARACRQHATHHRAMHASLMRRGELERAFDHSREARYFEACASILECEVRVGNLERRMAGRRCA